MMFERFTVRPARWLGPAAFAALLSATACDGNRAAPPAGASGGTMGSGGAPGLTTDGGLPGSGGTADGGAGATGTGLFGGLRLGGSPGSGGGGSSTGGAGGAGGTDPVAACIDQHCAREIALCDRTASCPAFLSCFLACETSACSNGCFDRFGDVAAAAALNLLQCVIDFCAEPDGPPNCRNSCLYSGDNECDDGGPGAVTSLCRPGTDCRDCGPR